MRSERRATAKPTTRVTAGARFHANATAEQHELCPWLTRIMIPTSNYGRNTGLWVRARVRLRLRIGVRFRISIRVSVRVRVRTRARARVVM